MLASLNWLRHYVEIEETPEALAEILTKAGLPVEYIIRPGEGLSGVVTGRVAEITHHPDADKLWVCRMDTGEGEPVQIITGAQNVSRGAVVPVALVGATLPNGTKLKKAKMRGWDSFGMLCSAAELGLDAKVLLPEQREGILLLAEDTPIGVDIKAVLGLDDIIFDFDLTANRADCFNLVGLAREIAALTGKKLKWPELSVREETGHVACGEAAVSIAAGELCPRFAVRIFRDVKIGASSAEIQRYLRACGVRPINNVVDVTNFVMLELGQPLHAYDYDLVAGHKLSVRRAQDGENLITLDGQKRDLTAAMLVIADEEKAVGLAGVMGGLATEVTADTRTVMLEAATFNGAVIRRTGRALGLRSEASGRFERGVDTSLTKEVLDRAAHLLVESGAAAADRGIVDAYPQPAEPTVVTVTAAWINGLLGIEVAREEMVKILEGLGFLVKSGEEGFVITVPTWRGDVTCGADIAEEIARVHGLDNIKSHLPVLQLTKGGQHYLDDIQAVIKDYLTACGLDEAINYTFINPTVLAKLRLPEDDRRLNVIELLNPITEDFKVMRTTLVPGILGTVSYNKARQSERVAVFEVGKTFHTDPENLPLKEFPQETLQIAVCLTGKRKELQWEEGRAEFDFFDIKGILTGLLEHLQIRDYVLKRATAPYLHPGKAAAVEFNGREIGVFGELHPEVQKDFGFDAPLYLLELAVEPLTEDIVRVPRYKALPKFPGTSRDLALVVPFAVQMSDLIALIKKEAGPLLEEVELFDVYTGKQVADGCKSMAFRLDFRAADRTLTDGEIDEVTAKIVAATAGQYQAKLRE